MYEVNKMNIGNVIINLLDKNNMSQRELAVKLKIAPTTLNGYIKNKHEPDCTTLKSIAKIFGVSANNDFISLVASCVCPTSEFGHHVHIFLPCFSAK